MHLLKIKILLALLCILNCSDSMSQIVQIFPGTQKNEIDRVFLNTVLKNESKGKGKVVYVKDTIESARGDFKNRLGRLMIDANLNKCHVKYICLYSLDSEVVQSVEQIVFCDSKCVEKTVKNIKSYFTLFWGLHWRKLNNDLYITRRNRVKIKDSNGKRISFPENLKPYVKATLNNERDGIKCFSVVYEFVNTSKRDSKVLSKVM